jgi:hypothetical protein
VRRQLAPSHSSCTATAPECPAQRYWPQVAPAAAGQASSLAHMTKPSGGWVHGFVDASLHASSLQASSQLPPFCTA